jgi:hypothetical protein
MSDINFCNTKEQLNHLGEVVTGKVNGSPSGADIDTSTLSYTGQVRKTLPALEGEYEQSITNKEAEADAAIDSYRLLNKGAYAYGITLESKFEFITYDGESYFATNPPYTTTTTTPDADVNLFAGGYLTAAIADSRYSIETTLSSIASGSFSVGATVTPSERGGGRFLVVSGGTHDGYGILDAGNGNTAVLQHNGELKCEWLGATTTMTLTEDRSPNIQAAVNYDTENVRKLTCTSKIYLASQINWRSGLSARFDGRIIIDENSAPGGIIFNVITTRFTGDGIYVDVCSRHLDGQDLHSYAGDITKTPTCRVLYTRDCRRFKLKGSIIGVKTKPVETGDTGYEYDFSDLHLWGPNITDIVDFNEPDNLQSERYTIGLYAPLFDSTLKNNVVCGYHVPFVVRGSWTIENIHPWALWSPMMCGIALFGSFNKLTGIYPDTISSFPRSETYADANYDLTSGKYVLKDTVTDIDETNIRLGAGIFEVPLVDRPSYTTSSNVDGNTINNWHVAMADRTKFDAYGVVVGDEDIAASGPNTDIGNGNLPFQSTNPASINDQRRSRVLYRGAAKFRSDRRELSGVTKRYGVTHVNGNVIDSSIAVNIQQLCRMVIEQYTGFYGECTITVNSNDTQLRSLVPSSLFTGSDELSYYFKTNKNLDEDTCYITLTAENLQNRTTSYKVTYSYNSSTGVALFENERYYQEISRGSTASRPTTGLTTGFQHFDTSLQTPIWWSGSSWKNATGDIV